MRVSSRPRVGDSMTISSPSASQTRGSRTLPTPSGVPVETMSPGSSVISRERWESRLRDAEDQVGGRGLLHLLAVERQRDPDRVVRPGLVGRDQRRPAGGGAVEDLAGHPLRGGELQVAGGEVVEQRVAGDVVERVGLGDVLGAPADDEGDLGLVVDLAAVGRQLHRRARRAASALRYLPKIVGLAGGSDPALGRVLAVVEADADDLLRVGDRRQQRDRATRVRRRAGVAEPPAQVVDPPGREQLPQAAPVRLAEQRPGVDDASSSSTPARAPSPAS